MSARITKGTSGNGYERFTISIAPRIARRVPDGQRFEAEFVEEGILLRRVELLKKTLPPMWTKP